MARNIKYSTIGKALLVSIFLWFSYSLDQLPVVAEESATILSDDFSLVPVHKETVEVASGVERRTTFGKWGLVAPGTLQASNVLEDKHGPVLAYSIPIDNAVITCEFKLPESPAENRHFRIFLDHPDYRGHAVNATANISSKFRPPGVTLQHLQKDPQAKKFIANIEFDTVEIDLTPSQWHTMKVTLIDDYVKVEVDGKTMTEGRSEHFKVTKNKIGLNSGIAGGWIRNFKVTEVPNIEE